MSSSNVGSQLVAEYWESLRATLVQQEHAQIEDLDVLAKHVEAESPKRRHMRVCMVGESQVGKSSLINAILGRRIMPAGGVGPLTARELTLTPDLEDSLDVRYFGIDAVRAVAQAWKSAPSTPDEMRESALIEDKLLALFCGGLPEASAVDSNQLTTLVEALDDHTKLPPGLATDLVARTESIRYLLGSHERVARSEVSSEARFRTILHQRVAGWRSPLISELHLRLHLPTWQHVQFVDLPGVGTMGDAARHVASESLSGGWDSLIVVVRNSGITEPVAEFLEECGALERLRGKGPTPNLLFCITHLDDVARLSMVNASDPRWRSTAFDDLAQRAKEYLHGQLATLLGRDNKDSLSLAQAVPVIATAAPDHLAIKNGHRDLAFVSSEESTGIFETIETVTQWAQDWRAAQDLQLTPLAQSFRKMLASAASRSALAPDIPGTETSSPDEILARLKQQVLAHSTPTTPTADRISWQRLLTETYAWEISQEGRQELIPERLESLVALAAILRNSGRYAEAHAQLEEAATGFAWLHGSTRKERYHLRGLQTRFEQARVLGDLHKTDDALQEFRRLGVICRRQRVFRTEFEALAEATDRAAEDMRHPGLDREARLIMETVEEMQDALDEIRAFSVQIRSGSVNESYQATPPPPAEWHLEVSAASAEEAVKLARREFERGHPTIAAAVKLHVEARADTQHDPDPYWHGTEHMEKLDTQASHFLDYYRDELRGVFKEHSANYLSTLDSSAVVLSRTLKLPAELSMGFLGESQVGKSTLINALLDKRALPSGGVGPLTAQEILVEHGDEDEIHIGYHTRQKLNQIAFPIGNYLERRELAAKRQSEAADAGQEDESQFDDALEGSLAEYLLDQARKMLTEEVIEDDSIIDDTLVYKALRAVISGDELIVPAELSGLVARVKCIQERVGQVETMSVGSLGSQKAFARELKLRAASWMAPLVSRLKVRLSTAFLDHISLVDLPGIGVFADAAGKVAEEFVRREGDALVLVMTNKGMPENLARLLEQTGVITKLLFGGEEENTPIEVCLVVTHLDDVAKTRYQTLMEEMEDDDGDDDDVDPPDRQEIFASLSNDMAQRIRSQLRETLLRSESFADLPQDKSDRRRTIVENLCNDLKVFCVAAPDYQALRRKRMDFCFLQSEDSTGIPALRAYLSGIANTRLSHRAHSIDSALESLTGSAQDQMAALVERYADRGPKNPEWDNYARAVQAACPPLREEMAAYHGDLMSSLSREMPLRLERLCAAAADIARKKLRRIRKHADTLTYPSLNAALKRKGRWTSRDINYPASMSSAIVDSVASDWEKEIVKGLKERINGLARRDATLVSKLLEVAQSHDPTGTLSSATELEAQRNLMLQAAETCVSWSNERLDQLRKHVHEELHERILEMLGKACDKAITAGKNRGTGAKNRILEALEEGSLKALERAEKAAFEVLNGHYQSFLNELQTGYLAQNNDPLENALDALVGEGEARAKHEEAQRRQTVHAQLLAVQNRLTALASTSIN